MKAKVTVENQLAVRFEFACALAEPIAAAGTAR
jgi:hypothetical protein